MLPTLNTEKLFQTKAWADVTIKSGSKELKRHKVVLGSCCEYFAKLLDPASEFAEAGRNVIELHDDVPFAVEAMIRYIYTGRMREPGVKHNYDWRFYLEVMRVADKYLLADLSDDAFTMFEVKVHELEVPQEVADVLAAIRGDDHAHDMANIANALEARHFHYLVQIPAYFDTLTSEQLRELWILGDKKEYLVKMWLYTCKLCGNQRTQFNEGHQLCRKPDSGHGLWHLMDETECWVRREDSKELDMSAKMPV